MGVGKSRSQFFHKYNKLQKLKKQTAPKIRWHNAFVSNYIICSLVDPQNDSMNAIYNSSRLATKEEANNKLVWLVVPVSSNGKINPREKQLNLKSPESLGTTSRGGLKHAWQEVSTECLGDPGMQRHFESPQGQNRRFKSFRSRVQKRRCSQFGERRAGHLVETDGAWPQNICAMAAEVWGQRGRNVSCWASPEDFQASSNQKKCKRPSRHEVTRVAS